MCCTVGCALPMHICSGWKVHRRVHGRVHIFGCETMLMQVQYYNVQTHFLGPQTPWFMYTCTHTLHSVPPSASTFHCHCVLIICMATCLSVYCCVVMMLSLKCSLLPDWCHSIIHFLSGGTYSSGGSSDCSQRRCQPST